jgi:hypothetical protein
MQAHVEHNFYFLIQISHMTKLIENLEFLTNLKKHNLQTSL